MMRALALVITLLAAAALADDEAASGVGVIHRIAEDGRSLNLTHDPFPASAGPR